MSESAGKKHVSSLAGDRDIGPILPRFVGRLPGQVAKLRALLAAGDVEGLCKLLHQLRGAGKSYGFARLTELAAEAEEGLLAGQSPEAVRGVLDGLIDYVECIEGYAQ